MSAMRHDRARPWYQRQAFGCLFMVVLLIVLGSIAAVLATQLSRLEPVPLVVTIAVTVVVVAAMLRGLGGAARELDRLLSATRRVQDGDYSVRVSPSRSDLPPIQELVRGFDTMVARLEADEEQRRMLLADVSHELRTPLAVIIGNLEGVLDGVYPADREHLTEILEQTKVTARLVGDLRTIAQSEAGTLSLQLEPTDPEVLVSEVVHSFAPAAEAAGITLSLDIDGDLPILEIDPIRIRSVLSNLVSNALRSTPSAGRVTVGASATRRDLRLTVRDTGAGIEPALRAHVFDRFVKGSESRGSGLGLAIARALVEAHGGSISVASTGADGTTFRVVLPLEAGG